MTDLGQFDVAVVGLGAAGAATLAALARMGAKAVGLDQFAPPHALGSSHGETRLLRTAYSEGAAYVPMVRRAIGLWHEMEARTGATLFRQTGVTYCGPQGNAFLASAREAARLWAIALPDSAVDPGQLRIPAGWQSFEDRDGGYLLIEPAMAAFLQDARAHGARTLLDCRCDGIDRSGAQIVLRTTLGELRTNRVVVAAGAWADVLLPELRTRVHTERRVLHWYDDRDGRYAAAAGFKPFLVATVDRMFYGFPAVAGGAVKVAEHFSGARIAGPDAVDRTIAASDTAPVDAFVAEFMPGLGARVRSAVCLYPMSWDEHFILDRLPDDPRIVIGVGLSGHGFKFAPVIGEALADLALERARRIDVGYFSLARGA